MLAALMRLWRGGEVVVALIVAASALLWRWADVRMQRRHGEEAAKQEAIKDAAKRVEAGRKAVAGGREHGDPDERLRRNDSQW